MTFENNKTGDAAVHIRLVVHLILNSFSGDTRLDVALLLYPAMSGAASDASCCDAASADGASVRTPRANDA